MSYLSRGAGALAVGVFALCFALGAQASPAMFDASFVFHAWGNDISSGTTSPYDSNYWVAAPLGTRARL